MVREPLPDHGLISNLGYWLCYPESRANVPPLLAFRQWMQGQSLSEREPTGTSPMAPQKNRSKQRGAQQDL